MQCAIVCKYFRKKRTIYVRWPEPNETNANIKLIEKGATAVDINGNEQKNITESLKQEAEIFNSKIISILLGEPMTSKGIISKLNLDWSDAKLKKHLEKMQEIEKKKIKNRIYYKLKDNDSNFLAFKFE